MDNNIEALICRIKENQQKIRFMEWIDDEKSKTLIEQLKKKTDNLKKMLRILQKHGDQDE